MVVKASRLADQVANDIIAMITIDKKYALGDKLPNENDLSASLRVSRSTLRESIRILCARNVLVVRRGRGTFVLNNHKLNEEYGFKDIPPRQLDVKALYEARLIFEPHSAYLAAKRGTDREIQLILHYGKLVEEAAAKGQDRREVERAFHKAIAKATHNEFITQLMPIIYKAIDRGVCQADMIDEVLQQAITDHRVIMEFLSKRDPEGAETAMRLHILHTIRGFGIQPD